jgi:hypothetical protein
VESEEAQHLLTGNTRSKRSGQDQNPSREQIYTRNLTFITLPDTSYAYRKTSMPALGNHEEVMC